MNNAMMRKIISTIDRGRLDHTKIDPFVQYLSVVFLTIRREAVELLKSRLCL